MRGPVRIDGLPPGRYVPMAGAWGYDAINGPPVQVGPGHRRPASTSCCPSSATAGRAGRPDDRQTARRKLPVPRAHGRHANPFHVHPGRSEYRQRPDLPPTNPPGPASDRAPTLVIIYPSHPLNWNAASVALTRNGNPVLALGPHTSGGLDIDQHARNFRAALQLWQSGQLTPLGQPDDTWVAMSGSFGSLIIFKALADLPAPPRRSSTSAASATRSWASRRSTTRTWPSRRPTTAPWPRWAALTAIRLSSTASRPSSSPTSCPPCS